MALLSDRDDGDDGDDGDPNPNHGAFEKEEEVVVRGSLAREELEKHYSVY